MPETLDELDEAIHALQTRIDCLTAVDNSVSSSYVHCFLLTLVCTVATCLSGRVLGLHKTYGSNCNVA